MTELDAILADAAEARQLLTRKGAKDERAAIVAWLRGFPFLPEYVEVGRQLADGIERGYHLPESQIPHVRTSDAPFSEPPKPQTYGELIPHFINWQAIADDIAAERLRIGIKRPTAAEDSPECGA